MFANIKEYLFWKRQIKKIETCTEPISIKNYATQINFKSAPHWFIKRSIHKISLFIDDSDLKILSLDLMYEIYKREKEKVINGI